MEAIQVAKLRGEERENEAREVLSLFRDFEVDSEETSEFAAGLLREVKARGEIVELERKKISDPLRQATNAVNALFKPAHDMYIEAEKLLKTKIADYQERKELANRAALELAAKSETVEEAKQAIELVDQAGPPKGVSVRHVWKFSIVDSDAVPREYCSPDPSKIKAATAFAPDGSWRPIPGVHFFQEPIVSSRKVT